MVMKTKEIKDEILRLTDNGRLVFEPAYKAMLRINGL